MSNHLEGNCVVLVLTEDEDGFTLESGSYGDSSSCYLRECFLTTTTSGSVIMDVCECMCACRSACEYVYLFVHVYVYVSVYVCKCVFMCM